MSAAKDRLLQKNKIIIHEGIIEIDNTINKFSSQNTIHLDLNQDGGSFDYIKFPSEYNSGTILWGIINGKQTLVNYTSDEVKIKIEENYNKFGNDTVCDNYNNKLKQL